jgi:plasmid segregation protein ParM
MSYILGIDVGYLHTKVCGAKGTDIFLSTLVEGTNEVNKKAIKIEHNGKSYTIGERSGKFSTALNKIQDPIFRLCLFTAIARQMKNDTVADIYLITGLPAEYFQDQKQELMESLEDITETIVINNVPKRFTIRKCIVFPQSAGLFILNPQDFEGTDNIVIDIGGLTVDVSLFNDLTLVKTGTFELGMLKLYDKVVQAIKAKHRVSYDTLRAVKIIKDNKIIVDGKDIDVTNLIDKILQDHTDEIIMNVVNRFKEYHTSIRNFMGGGSWDLKKYLPEPVKKDDIYLNAKAFYQVGVSKFEKK